MKKSLWVVLYVIGMMACTTYNPPTVSGETGTGEASGEANDTTANNVESQVWSDTLTETLGSFIASRYVSCTYPSCSYMPNNVS